LDSGTGVGAEFLEAHLKSGVGASGPFASYRYERLRRPEEGYGDSSAIRRLIAAARSSSSIGLTR
jgi:hypothetical protein